jgi:hypothetical protein
VAEDNKNNRGSKKYPAATIDAKAKEVKSTADKSNVASGKPAAAAKSSAQKQLAAPEKGVKVAAKAQEKNSARPDSGKKTTADPEKTTNTKSKTQTAPTSSGKTGKSGSSTWSMTGIATTVLAVIFGGICTFAAVIYAMSNGIISTESSSKGAMEALEARLAKIEADAGDLAGDDERISAIITRLENTEKNIRKLGQTQQIIDERTGRIEDKVTTQSGTNIDSELYGRVQELETTLTELTKIAQSVDDQGVLQASALTARITELEQGINSELANRLGILEQTLQTEISERDARINDAIEARAKLLAGRIDNQPSASDLEEMKGKYEALAKQGTAMQNNINTVEQAIANFPDASVHVARVEEKINGLDKKIAGVISREKKALQAGRSTALAVAMSNLKTAVTRGQSYKGELDIAKKISTANIDLAPLEASAAHGIPTVDSLIGDFSQYAGAALDTTAAGQETVSGKVVAGLRSFIRIRRVDNLEGSGLESIIARMEKSLASGDLKATLMHSEMLAGAAQKAMQPWLDKVNARLVAIDTISRIETQMLAAMSGSRGASDGEYK